VWLQRLLRSSKQKRLNKFFPNQSSFCFAKSLFTFFCLDTKESNKEKIKKQSISSTIVSFALIELQCYCDLNC
jgi:hypothetical protein